MLDQPASNRLRIGRYDEPNRVYLLTSNTLDRIPIFSDFKLGRLVVQQFRIAQHQGLATSLAWVVMPDHFHWLISLEKGSLADLMRQVKSKSTRIVNAVSGRQGRLWQPGFHDHAVRREESLEGIARYIVANPLRAGLVKKCGDYPLWDAIWL
ncbi:REP-associated tyrosine transposase [Pseudomonas simiae]|uniref:REP-associated tyrosine transposase n=1 Tax=Pseudomonas simiae TaxID=321846 RepID=UPI000D035D89|nr:transposase [Pseudomonas simiae]PRW84415.1 transposase [Pseudomonas simiae]WLH20181.1 transposase [Pseudomonas simiae]